MDIYLASLFHSFYINGLKSDQKGINITISELSCLMSVTTEISEHEAETKSAVMERQHERKWGKRGSELSCTP